MTQIAAPGSLMFSPAAGARQAWPANLVLAAELVMFGMSGGMLWYLGVNYEGLSGSVAGKIHPSTYMLFLIFIWAAFKSGSPVGYLAKVANLRPASLFLFVSATLMFVHTFLRGASGMAGAIDTFLPAALLVMILSQADERGMRRLEIALHIIMAVNAVMAIGEFATKTLVFPYRFDGQVFPTDTRSSALQGHPLTNAAMTAWYAMALLTGGRSLPKNLKLPLFVLQFAALVPFGGRSAMVISLVLGGVFLMVQAHKLLRTGHISLAGAALGILLLTLVPMALGALATEGFFDALLSRFVSDGGSAHARVEMFELFRQLPFRDFWSGPDNGLLGSLRRMDGLEWGVENPIIRTLLYQGIFVTVLMTLAVGLYLWELSRLGAHGLWLPMLTFILLMQTAETLGGKTTMLTKFALTILCMYRPVSKPPGRIHSASVRRAENFRPKPVLRSGQP